MPEVSISNHNYTSEKCKQIGKRRLSCTTLQRCFEASRFFVQINADILTLLEAFPYLGRNITYNNISWAAIYLNICKYWRRWGVIARVLERTGAMVPAWGEIYRAVAQL